MAGGYVDLKKWEVGIRKGEGGKEGEKLRSSEGTKKQKVGKAEVDSRK
jgi:hypothetical protein